MISMKVKSTECWAILSGIASILNLFLAILSLIGFIPTLRVPLTLYTLAGEPVQTFLDVNLFPLFFFLALAFLIISIYSSKK